MLLKHSLYNFAGGILLGKIHPRIHQGTNRMFNPWVRSFTHESEFGAMCDHAGRHRPS
jgi:hypothetical protein